jgi:F-type H+-transporting ATPase subunit delta
MTIDLKTSSAQTVLDPQAITLGRVYAQALTGLLEGARPEDLQSTADELRDIAQLIRQASGGQEFLAGAGKIMNRQQRRAFVERVFAGRVSKPVEQLLGVLAGNGRVELIEAIGRQFADILLQREGVVDVSVTSAVELTDAQRQKLQQVLARALRARPVLHTNVQKDLIGGVVVKVGDTVYDGSVAGDLARLTEAMKNNIPRRTAE